MSDEMNQSSDDYYWFMKKSEVELTQESWDGLLARYQHYINGEGFELSIRKIELKDYDAYLTLVEGLSPAEITARVECDLAEDNDEENFSYSCTYLGLDQDSLAYGLEVEAVDSDFIRTDKTRALMKEAAESLSNISTTILIVVDENERPISVDTIDKYLR